MAIITLSCEAPEAWVLDEASLSTGGAQEGSGFVTVNPNGGRATYTFSNVLTVYYLQHFLTLYGKNALGGDNTVQVQLLHAEDSNKYFYADITVSGATWGQYTVTSWNLGGDADFYTQFNIGSIRLVNGDTGYTGIDLIELTHESSTLLIDQCTDLVNPTIEIGTYNAGIGTYNYREFHVLKETVPDIFFDNVVSTSKVSLNGKTIRTYVDLPRTFEFTLLGTTEAETRILSYLYRTQGVYQMRISDWSSTEFTVTLDSITPSFRRHANPSRMNFDVILKEYHD